MDNQIGTSTEIIESEVAAELGTLDNNIDRLDSKVATLQGRLTVVLSNAVDLPDKDNTKAIRNCELGQTLSSDNYKLNMIIDALDDIIDSIQL